MIATMIGGKYTLEHTEDPECIPGFERDGMEPPEALNRRTLPQGTTDRNVIPNNRRAATTYENPIMISGSMSQNDIAQILANHSCSDITAQLDLPKCGSMPIRGGGFGDVYEGTLITNQKVAIKCARLFVCSREGYAQTTKNLARELYTWSKCHHQNILELCGLAHYKNQIATVSPWMDNGTLPFYIKEKKNIGVIRELCYQVSCGVEYLHGMGAVHGDIKGANVLIASDGTAKLADFGNTVLRAYSLRFTGMTDESALSIRWTAPELLNGAAKVTREADVYALAMTILEAFTGDVPFPDKSEMAVLVDVMLRGKTPDRPETHFPAENEEQDDLWKMLQRCWNTKPEGRPLVTEIRNNLEGSFC